MGATMKAILPLVLILIFAVAAGEPRRLPRGPTGSPSAMCRRRPPPSGDLRAAQDSSASSNSFGYSSARSRLPRTLQFKLAGCDGDANAAYEDGVYHHLLRIHRRDLEKRSRANHGRRHRLEIDALVGPIFDTCLHEFAHALFEMLKIPVFGREEDAADQVAAYITLQLGKAEARRLIGGTANAYMTEARAAAAPPTLQHFANEHGTPAQRFYNLLCIAYGADPKLFGDLTAKGYLPKERAEGCEDEYKQAALAAQTLIGPHVDQKRVKKVLDKSGCRK